MKLTKGELHTIEFPAFLKRLHNNKVEDGERKPTGFKQCIPSSLPPPSPLPPHEWHIREYMYMYRMNFEAGFVPIGPVMIPEEKP